MISGSYMEFSRPQEPLEVGLTAVPTARTDVAGGKNAKVYQIVVVNTTAAPVNITVDDGSNRALLAAKAIPANDAVVLQFPAGVKLSGGIFWQASAAGLNGSIAAYREF